MTAPVCLFTYNRIFETQQTIDALKLNYISSESELVIFSDGPKNNADRNRVETLRNYLKTISGFRSVEIFESTENKGLADSIIQGVTWILKKYENVIVLEDDLITAPNFLNFMNQALDFYREDSRVQSISGYSLSVKDKSKEVYFQLRPGSWGWATWKNQWNPEIFNKEKLLSEINLNRSVLRKFKLQCGADISNMLLESLTEKNESWYVRWAFNHFSNQRYSVYPAYSFVNNIGFGF
ncbi:MAG: glycosyltransferase, partial [Paludibacter sp.]